MNGHWRWCGGATASDRVGVLDPEPWIDRACHRATQSSRVPTAHVTVGDRVCSLLWAHRGLGTDLWLQTTSTEAGVLLLARTDEPDERHHLGRDVARDPQQTTLALSSVLSGRAAPQGTWSLQLLDDRGVVHDVLGSPRATASLGGIRLLVDDAAFDLKVMAGDGQPVLLELTPREPWAEFGRLVLTERTLLVEAQIPAVVGQVTGAVWTLRGEDTTVASVATVEGSLARIRTELEHLGGAPGAVWDLWVRCGSERLRVGGHLDDVTDKRQAVTFPVTRRADSSPPVRFEPYFTAYNNLSLRISVLETEHRDPRDAPVEEVPRPATRGDRRRRQLADRGVVGVAAPPTRLHAVLNTVASALLELLARRSRTARRRGALTSEAPVHLLLANAYGVGGTIRTTFNTANALAHRRPVTVVSVYRVDERPYFALDDAVPLRPLVDYVVARSHAGPRHWLRRLLIRVPSTLVHDDDPRAHRFNLLTDLHLIRYIRSVHEGSLIGTRPGLNAAIARFARPGVAAIGQQHLPYEFQTDDLWDHDLAGARGLDLLTVLTEHDAGRLRSRPAGASLRIEVLPNPLSSVTPPKSPLNRRCIVAAGRYSRTKGIDLLLEAFARVAPDNPAWELRVYGKGKPHQLERARAIIRSYGMSDQVRLMAATERLEAEMSKASLAAVASRFEAFGMVLIEAMSCGLPVVSFACPNGPAEILTDGEDGRLVPAENVEAFAGALRDLMQDEQARQRLGDAARRSADRFAPDRVVSDLEALLASLARPKRK
jgi:glycosyltransferase involved in cell wall biosynthesis